MRRFISTARTEARSRRSVKAAALSLSLIAGAYLMAEAVASDGSAWLGCVTLLPLFVAIRACRPIHAGLCGALWGSSLYLFGVSAGDFGVSASPLLFALLTAIPAIYAYLGARLTRWIGFSPFVLGVGWMGVELALVALGLRTGLLAGTQDGGTLLHWVGGALGYVLVAFLVAYVNAALVSALAAARFRVPRPAWRIGSPDRGTRLVPQTVSCPSLLPIHAVQPRAPPAYPALGCAVRVIRAHPIAQAH